MENESLPGILSSIDTLLCLHFASSTTIPTLFELCTKATHLTKRRVDQSVVEQIVGYDPTLYNVVYTGTSCNDYGLSIPSGVSLAKFGASIPHRKTKLEEKVRDTSTSYPPAKLASLVRLQKPVFVESPSKFHRHSLSVSSSPSKDRGGFGSASLSPTKRLASNLDLLPVTPTKKGGAGLDYDLDSPTEMPDSPTKLRYRTSPSKVTKLSELLSNSPKKFVLKQMPVEKGSMSLLERIKLKEKLRNEEKELHSPEKAYRERILSKMPQLYNVIYELSSSDESLLPQFKCFSIPKIISMVQDSFTLTISEQEVKDTISELTKAIPSRIEIIEQGSILAIKVHKLNREEDLVNINESIKIN